VFLLIIFRKITMQL